jgi:hypothetical protein
MLIGEIACLCTIFKVLYGGPGGFIVWRGPSWSWWYRIFYSFLCNQCLSLLRLYVWIPLMRGVLDTTLYAKVCQWLATGRWFSPCPLMSSTNKTDRHDTTEILLNVALNTTALNAESLWMSF